MKNFINNLTKTFFIIALICIAISFIAPSDCGFGLFLLPFLIISYIFPSIIAFSRKHNNKVPILIVNLIFGWTFIGYIIAFIWSFTSSTSNFAVPVVIVNK